MNFRISAFLAIVFLFAGCTGTKELVSTVSAQQTDVEFRQLDTLTITTSKSEPAYKLPVYNPSAERVHDLLHTKLDVRFDWTKQHLLGKATLTLKSHFYKTKILTLDAKGFDIHKIQLLGKNGSTDLRYKYDGLKLEIDLGRAFEADQKFDVYIDYTAKPNDLAAGGSAAITSDKGLYFINPLGEEPGKPMQIWTQGETEASSCWFPTIDKPNERCTQEISITIEDKFQTLSNGMLKSSKKNTDGTRTDTYVLDKPHAPYLFMLSIGEYFVQKEMWKNVLLEYIVEPEYRESAKAIFSNTPEMLDFFSGILGDYPWPKYSQVVVRDYVSGAMENTTAVVYGEPVQKTNRELIDNHNERIVAHELIHQWFGDLVTCESWANLTMNEGFASYGEYLWFAHKYGEDAANYHLMIETNGYFRQARRNMHQLIYFDYLDKEDTFDSHSYNKGGIVLHMLRNYVGDAAFFASLRKYLTDNAFSSVEAHNLRLAFEAVTGKDLNWFFNQWFFEKGHPVLEVAKTYDAEKRQLEITVTQTQNAEKSLPIFQLPVAVEIHQGPRKMRENIWVNQRKQTFTFDVATKPTWVSFDADRALLAEITETDKTTAEYIEQYHSSLEFVDRYNAISHLATVDTDAAKTVINHAIKDPYWVIRRLALRSLDNPDPTMVEKLALHDPRSHVRVSALDALGKFGDPKYADVAKKVIENDQAYRCVGAGLSALNEMDPKAALTYAGKMEDEENTAILRTIGEMYAASGDLKYLSFFENNWHKIKGFSAMSFFRNYIDLVKLSSPEIIDQSMLKLKKLGTDGSLSTSLRYSATKGISDMRKAMDAKALEATDAAERSGFEARSAALQKMIKDIIALESNERLKRFYAAF